MKKIAMKLEFVGMGSKPIKMKVELTTLRPMPNHEHESLADVRPLSIVRGDVNFYPTFQRFPGPNTLYRNIASCLLCFRTSNPQVSDFDIVLWFHTPNESLDGKTPLEIGSRCEKEVRKQIVDAAEQDAPLGRMR